MNKYSPVKTVEVPAINPPDRDNIKKYNKQKPAHKVGKVIWEGGTKVGSFEKGK